jgi:hypothetical protein
MPSSSARTRRRRLGRQKSSRPLSHGRQPQPHPESHQQSNPSTTARSHASNAASGGTSTPTRTEFDLMADILSVLSGQPIARIRQLIHDFAALNGTPNDGPLTGASDGGPLTEEEYRIQRVELMTFAPEISGWLHGAIGPQVDSALIEEVRYREVHRN